MTVQFGKIEFKKMRKNIHNIFLQNTEVEPQTSEHSVFETAEGIAIKSNYSYRDIENLEQIGRAHV